MFLQSVLNSSRLTGTPMNISFEKKVALVTGAGSGLGLATARAFAESGASVALADANEKAARSAAEELSAQGHKTLAIKCDVADDAQVEAMVERTVALSGGLMRLTTMPAFRILLQKPPTLRAKTLTGSFPSICAGCGVA
jgi:hypothetical protein